MKNSLVKEQSPLGRLRRRGKVAMKPGAARISAAEQAELRELFATPSECVYDEIFEQPDAREQLFDNAPEIPQPNTSWYHPVMEDLVDNRTLKQVVNVVLTAKQERALFLQFNYARWRVGRIREQLGDEPVSTDQARELLHWRRVSMDLRDQIAQSNLALVLAMAKRIRHSEMDFSDLISEGNMALLRAVDKFNVSRGFKFSTYACRAILKAFSRSGIKHSRHRQMFPTDFDPALEKSDHQRRKYDSHEDECADEVKQIVLDNRAELTDVEQAVIHHRFAINHQDSRPLTLEQVGQIVGLTKERVRQIQNKALGKIRNTLETDYLDTPQQQDQSDEPHAERSPTQETGSNADG